MKNLLYILGLGFASLFLSCEDFLDAPPESSLEESVVFASPELAKNAVLGILDPMGATNSYRGRFLTHYGSNTDIEWYNTPTATTDRAKLARYENSSTNTDMNSANNVWGEIYKGIERANVCIKGIEKYGDTTQGSEFSAIYGTALTYRAIYYADLVKAWGDVPARFEPVSTSTIYIAKSSRDVIYKKVISDLQRAENLVPWKSEGATTETINKAFVKALRARLCMAAAGYSQYPDGIHKSTDSELSSAVLYPIALKECQEIISNGYAYLETSFETLFRKNCQEDITAGGESLWEIPFAEGRGRHLYTYGVKHSKADQYTAQSQGGQYGPLPFVFYDYDSLDLRRNVTCVPYQYGNLKPATNGIAYQELRTDGTWCFGKWRYEWMKRRVTSSNDDGINKIYMRFAEVLLIAAEVENELGNLSSAKNYLRLIRRRAFAQENWTVKVDAYLDNISSKEQMFDAIVKEHGFEFCGEMERKQALIRWNLLKSKMDEAKVKMTNLRSRTGEYATVPTKLYYRYVADEDGQLTKLDIYGLNRGQISSVSATYPNSTSNWMGTAMLTDAKITALYTGNPDQNEFWPIWQYFIDGSNGTLVNDYGY